MGRFVETLRKAHVELVDASRVLLRCAECKQVWSPNLLSGGRMPRGYWRCPNGCNVVPEGRPALPPEQRRSKRVLVYLTPAEHRQLARAAKGKDLGVFVREALLRSLARSRRRGRA